MVERLGIIAYTIVKTSLLGELNPVKQLSQKTEIELVSIYPLGRSKFILIISGIADLFAAKTLSKSVISVDCLLKVNQFAFCLPRSGSSVLIFYLANPNAANCASALFKDSYHSLSGSLSATIPAPTCP